MMATIRELEQWCKSQIWKGKGDLHTNHVIVVEEEAAKRGKNPPDEKGKRKTKICWEAGDPDVYALWHQQRERYFKCARSNPTLATEAMICALGLHSDDEIFRFLETLEKPDLKVPF